MMKKSVLLLCVLATFNTSVMAADIDARVNFKKIHIEVTDTKGVEVPTVQLLDKGKTKVLYTNEGFFDGNKYVFEDFSFPAEENTGEYIIRVGEDGTITEKIVKYSSFADIKNAVKALKDSGSNVIPALIGNAEIFGTAEARISTLINNWKTRLNNDILSLNPDYSPDDKVKESYNNIIDAIEKILEYQDLIDSGNQSRIEAAVAKMPFLDLEFWNKLSDKAALRACFLQQNIDEITIDDTKVSEAFDAAMLAAVIKASDWGTGRDALNYYSKKGILSVKSEYLNGDSALYKALKERNITNYRDIPNALDEIARALADNSKNNNGGGGGGTGGGSSSGGLKAPTMNNSAAEGKPSQMQTFNDLNGFEWAAEAINALHDKGIISGKGAGKFAPQDNITRAEFVKIIVSAFNLSDVNAYAEFEDVPSDSWCYLYVASAKKVGIIYGVDDKHFGANEEISRQDMAVIIARVMDMLMIPYSNEPTTFTDEKQISDYARESVMKLAQSGIVNGMGDGSFSPYTNVTRAQAARVIHGVMQKQGR